MNIFEKSVYIDRRNTLKKLLGSGQILLMGNKDAPINYTDNCYWFRQDSSFLYFFGINQPGLVALIDIDTNREIIFGEENTIDNLIWEGKNEKLSDIAQGVGVNEIEPLKKIKSHLKKGVHFLPPYRAENKILLAEFLNEKIVELKPSHQLIMAVISLRSKKEGREIDQMEKALKITKEMHLAAMKNSQNGKYEYEVVGEIMKHVYGNNTHLAYPVIFSTKGQILHNHSHEHKMKDGRLVLNDSGAQSLLAYAADITRTFPVSKKFDDKQKALYNLVLSVEEEAISRIKPGTPYIDVHKNAIKTLLEGLKQFDIFKGDSSEAMELGVGGLFMPHGLGHMIGLDVHDMEDLGEDNVGYTEGQKRSTQLGLKSLRLAKKLEEGFVLTVEPGIYFIPDLIDLWHSEKKFNSFINYAELQKWKEFGGIRIEDNILVTSNSGKILGEPIPKKVSEIEELK